MTLPADKGARSWGPLAVLAPGSGLQKIHLLCIALLTSILFTVAIFWLRSTIFVPPPPTANSLVHVSVVEGPLIAPPNIQNRTLQQTMASAQSGVAKEDTAHQPARITSAQSNPLAQSQLASVDTSVPIQRSDSTPTTNDKAAEFQRQLFLHIAQFEHYPEIAKAQNLRGTAQVLFSMDRKGRLLAVELKISSGSSLLDREAVDTVRRSAPLPPIPADLPPELTILLPVEFADK